jgi:hypothetical protein
MTNRHAAGGTETAEMRINCVDVAASLVRGSTPAFPLALARHPWLREELCSAREECGRRRFLVGERVSGLLGALAARARQAGEAALAAELEEIREDGLGGAGRFRGGVLFFFFFFFFFFFIFFLQMYTICPSHLFYPASLSVLCTRAT